MKKSRLEIAVDNRITSAGLPAPVPEYVFCEGRRWRFDMAWPDKKVALECEGGIWIQGRHNRGMGFLKDCEKYNTAVLMGWRVLRYTTATIDQIIPDLKKIL